MLLHWLCFMVGLSSLLHELKALEYENERNSRIVGQLNNFAEANGPQDKKDTVVSDFDKVDMTRKSKTKKINRGPSRISQRKKRQDDSESSSAITARDPTWDEETAFGKTFPNDQGSDGNVRSSFELQPLSNILAPNKLRFPDDEVSIDVNQHTGQYSTGDVDSDDTLRHILNEPSKSSLGSIELSKAIEYPLTNFFEDSQDRYNEDLDEKFQSSRLEQNAEAQQYQGEEVKPSQDKEMITPARSRFGQQFQENQPKYGNFVQDGYDEDASKGIDTAAMDGSVENRVSNHFVPYVHTDSDDTSRFIGEDYNFNALPNEKVNAERILTNNYNNGPRANVEYMNDFGQDSYVPPSLSQYSNTEAMANPVSSDSVDGYMYADSRSAQILDGVDYDSKRALKERSDVREILGNTYDDELEAHDEIINDPGKGTNKPVTFSQDSNTETMINPMSSDDIMTSITPDSSFKADFHSEGMRTEQSPFYPQPSERGSNLFPDIAPRDLTWASGAVEKQHANSVGEEDSYHGSYGPSEGHRAEGKPFTGQREATEFSPSQFSGPDRSDPTGQKFENPAEVFTAGLNTDKSQFYGAHENSAFRVLSGLDSQFPYQHEHEVEPNGFFSRNSMLQRFHATSYLPSPDNEMGDSRSPYHVNFGRSEIWRRDSDSNELRPRITSISNPDGAYDQPAYQSRTAELEPQMQPPYEHQTPSQAAASNMGTPEEGPALLNPSYPAADNDVSVFPGNSLMKTQGVAMLVITTPMNLNAGESPNSRTLAPKEATEHKGANIRTVFGLDSSDNKEASIYHHGSDADTRNTLATAGPIMSLGFDFEKEGLVKDRSRNGNDAFLENGAKLTAKSLGSCGRAVDLHDGDISWSGVNFKNAPVRAITIAMWLKAKRKGMINWFANGDTAATRAFFIQTKGARVPAKLWTHVTRTYDSRNGVSRIYLNGDLIEENRQKRGKSLSKSWLVNGIGPSFGDDSIRYVDEVYIYDRPLTGREVRMLYNRCTFNRMILHFGFQKGNATYIKDQSGLENDGILVGGASTQSECNKCGACLDLTKGRDPSMKIQRISTHHLPRTTVSISVWIRLREASGRRSIFVTESRTGNKGYCLQVINGRVRWSIGTDRDGVIFDNTTEGKVVQNNVWNHIAVTYNGQTGVNNIYLNGSLKLNGTVQKLQRSVLPSDWEKKASIGDENFKGFVDEFIMYNWDLDQPEVMHVRGYCADRPKRKRFIGRVPLRRSQK